MANGKLELRTITEPLQNDSGTPTLASKAILVLDSNAYVPALQHLGQGLQVLSPLKLNVQMPDSVEVIQIANRFGGKASLQQAGTKQAVLDQLATWRANYASLRQGVICPKDLVRDVIDMGFEKSLVLNFHGLRGTNSLEDVDVLHIVTRPSAPTTQPQQVAQVIHKNEMFVAGKLEMVSEPYEGTGKQIDVLDFADSRASTIYRLSRENELEQAVHRARPFRRDESKKLTIVLHTAHPIPGLRVDKLIEPDHRPKAINETRREDSELRIIAAYDELLAGSVKITQMAVAERAKASRRSVGRLWLNLANRVS